MQRQFAAILCAALLTTGAPVLADVPGGGALPVGPADQDPIGKEMTVQNWVLSTTEANAESIAKARLGGVEPAFKVYSDLQSTKACGIFASLKVILRQSLYESDAAQPHHTKVYRASVNLGTDWPTG